MRIVGRQCDSGDVTTCLVEGGKLRSFTPGCVDPDLGGPDWWLSPSFIDIQLNGYGGSDFNFDAWGGAGEVDNSVESVYQRAYQSGTALICPTITTNSQQSMIRALRRLAEALEARPLLARSTPGFHVEGPYIAREDGPRGAHPLEHVRDPEWDEFLRFQEAAGGRISLLTLAPELDGALRFIERLAGAGIVVAIGHTGAEPDIIRDAVRAGARLSTHLGNGAHAQIRRHPNYIWEQLANDSLVASIIADGHHLPPAVLKSFARVKGPERLILVSDAVSLGGLPAGKYAEGRYEVLPTGKVVLADTPYLAGAGHLLDVCISNAVRYTDLTLAQAVHCASAAPARLLNLDHRKGRLVVGSDADLALFRMPDHGPLEVGATLCSGEVVWQSEAL